MQAEFFIQGRSMEYKPADLIKPSFFFKKKPHRSVSPYRARLVLILKYA